MILRLAFKNTMDEFTMLKFYENPKGTCLASTSAVNITPQKIRTQSLPLGQEKLSFWAIDDMILEQFYGVNTCIQSLWTYPGVLSVQVIKPLGYLSSQIISWMTEDEVYSLIKPYVGLSI